MNYFMCGLFAFFLMMQVVPAAPRDQDWKKVEDAINKGLPKTAIEALGPIIKGALAEKKYGEAVKAIARRIVLEGTIEGNKPEEKVTRLEQEIAKAPAEIRPLLTALQAHWYWHYFQQNKWRFMRRTATAEAPGKDFTTWDLPRLFAEIDKKFAEALAAEKVLKGLKVADFGDVLEQGTMPDAYRPTLYDFVAHEALEFYTSGEQAAAKPQDAFEVPAEGEIFDRAEKFIAWNIKTEDTNSPVYRALRLYQDILRFHQGDKDKTAFLDADLGRLNYGKNIAFGEDKKPRFKSAAQRVADENPKHEIFSQALFHVAQTVREEGNLVEARNIALRGAEAFPKSVGAQNCRALIAEIEMKAANITTERVWNAPFPKIIVRYRNVDRVYFRAVAVDWNWFLDKPYGQPGYLDWDKRREYVKKEPVLAWSEKLPPTANYKERIQEMPAPEKLKPGYYIIIASHREDFGEDDNQVSMADVWVSDLAVVNRNRTGLFEGFVFQANSGEPVKGAEVQVWYLNNQNGKYVSVPSLTTDENGFFSLKGDQQRSYVFKVRHGEHELGSAHAHYSYHYGQGRRRYEQTIFFTDRAIYRPGQTIQFKGISLSTDQDEDKYEVIKGRDVTVMFTDVNGKEIARLKQQCNDFGSFSGSFTAPRDRLMGQMQIRMLEGPQGQASFRVEEYKRPKFQVTLDAPKTAPRLNEKVSLTGHAMAYTGAAIDGANVKYRVVREVRWPWWWWGWHRWGGGRHQGNDSQEIAHGSLKTEVDGTFKIEFVAKPDLSVAEKDEPTFVYRIFADVTDSAGETRSEDRTVNVGYAALQATLSAGEWQEDDKAVELTIRTQTLDGEGQSADGVVKIYDLKAPAKPQRAPLDGGHHPYYAMEDGHDGGPGPVDLSNPNNWETGKVIAEKKFSTDKEGKATLEVMVPAGAFRVMLETQDRFGKKVTARLALQVMKPNATKFPIRIPSTLVTKDYSLQPGDELLALWGTGYDSGRAFVEIEHRNKMLKRYWTKAGQTQESIKVAVTEAMRGGFTVHVTHVRENRGYLHSRHIDVPWSNKDLEIKWEHFTSKLQPNQKDTWTAVIAPKTNSGVAKVEKLAAEMVATLYDESLDQFTPHHWAARFSIFRQDYSSVQPSFNNFAKNFDPVWSHWGRSHVYATITYRHFPHDLTQNFWGYHFPGTRVQMKGGAPMEAFSAVAAPAAAMAEGAMDVAQKKLGREDRAESKDQLRDAAKSKRELDVSATGGAPAEPGTKEPDLSKVTARKNLNETAFFFPHLTSDSNGVVRMTFTMPEALTQWRFMGFAHDVQCRAGFFDGKTVTAKDLMVQPNPPRFLREGDEVEFTVKVSNQTDASQTGKVRLTFNNGLTDKSADAALGHTATEQSFSIEAKQSRSFSWRIKVPDGLSVLTYKAVGGTDKVSDGEEGFLPVLSRRIFVTESLPLPIRGPAEKTFQFKKLLESGKSETLKHQSLTVQMVSNPSWYAVMALPYLMEYPYECSEQIFNRLYANALARHIAKSDPKIHRVFEQWRGTPALDSPLEKNQELKSVLLEETPWVRQAADESQARKNVGLLFEDNRLNYEFERALQKLRDLQLDNGSWPWFPGGLPNDYITLYITTGFGRLRHLGVETDMAPAVRSLHGLDAWMDEHYRNILRLPHPEKYVPSATDALYLYGRSFFLKDQAVAKQHHDAVEFFLQRSREHWLKVDNRQSQGHLAIALKRFNEFNEKKDATPADIMKSIKERSVTNEELGMFWRELELSWWWFRAPIETQAMMIEAFDEVMKDEQSVEECKVWLLKQKQTQDWKTTKATADAVYALLLRGENVLASDALVEMSLGKEQIKPEKVEAGTGFYEQRFTASEVKPSFGEVTVKKVDKGVAWGSVHWQYFEDMTKVTPHEGTPLKLKKTLYKKVTTKRGLELQPIKGALEVGDELVVRIELRTDRDMEYVHMKDQRGSGTEPVNVVSHYKYQDGLRYYESTRDTASHFFIDYLPKGVYVFEYSTRVQLRGDYQSGIAEIQCMYAPEFNSHSESFKLTVK